MGYHGASAAVVGVFRLVGRADRVFALGALDEAVAFALGDGAFGLLCCVLGWLGSW